MRFLFCKIFLVVFGVTTFASGEFQIGEDAYRANNLGVALLEQYKHDEAAAQFKRALELKPDLQMAQLNLAIAFFNAQRLSDSKQTALAVLEKQPNSPHTNYILGLIGRTENNQDASIAAFHKVLAIDPLDVGTNVNIGQILSQRRQYDEAIARFQVAYEAEPYNTTVVYNLATALQRKGERERAAELLKLFQSLRESGAGTSIGINYLEQGRYAEAVASTGAEAELVDKAEPAVEFREANIGLSVTRSSRSAPFRDAALFDMDGDGDLDIALTNPTKLLRNNRGKFTDVTVMSSDFGRQNPDFATSIIAGDFDNDKLNDLFVARQKSYSLYKNLGKARFVDVTAKTKIPAKNDIVPALASAFADVDHDGDLDIVVGGSRLFRNNGDSSFTDFSRESKIDVELTAVSVVPTDFDNRRDIDLLMLASGDTPKLYRNLRNTTFQNVADEVGLAKKAAWSCAAVGDVNKDNYVDFFFGVSDGRGVFAVSDGRGKFKLHDAPAGTEQASAAQFIDYDNDGLLDLIATTSRGLVVVRNLGSSWTNATSQPFAAIKNANDLTQLLSADMDGDGDVDLISFNKKGALRFLRNDGGNANNARSISLKARVSNKSALGAKIDMRSGSLEQKLESYSASPMPAPSQIHLGLGKRENPDAVRVIWASGIVQSEIDFPAGSAKNAPPIKIEELDRKPSSCPYLYTWNGETFEFITDFLGGGEMGNWAAPGVYYQPDSDEFVRITSEQLKPRNGRYEIRVTNELEEVLFLDHLKLVAIEHDVGTQVYPNEGLGIPTFGKRILYTTDNARPPLAATDKDGKSVLAKITNLERDFYNSFRDLPIRGYAEQHELTLNLDDKKGHDGRTLLLLTGWTDYAFSSDNLAASQSGKSLFMPYLQVKNPKGEWQTVIRSIGISVGRPQTVVVDLTGKFLTDSREVRIVTNFKTYWDKIEVDVSEQTSAPETVELQPLNADLRDRGFSAENVFNGMTVATYENVSFDTRWKNLTGKFTRLGDVKPLLRQIDDTFVISKAGDELVLSFSALPLLPAGRQYTFLLYANGYSKEMDINSGSPDTVFPLPFKGMTKYPYTETERFPMTDEKQILFDEYTTRFVRSSLPKIDLALSQ